MRYTEIQKRFDEAIVRMVDHPGIVPNPEIKYEPIQHEGYPDDYAEGWEYYNQFHICWICGEQGHEDSMTRNNLHYWVHKNCVSSIETTIKNLP